MKEELETTPADDMEETEEVIVFTKEEFEALMAEEGIDEEEEDAEEIFGAIKERYESIVKNLNSFGNT